MLSKWIGRKSKKPAMKFIYVFKRSKLFIDTEILMKKLMRVLLHKMSWVNFRIIWQQLLNLVGRQVRGKMVFGGKMSILVCLLE